MEPLIEVIRSLKECTSLSPSAPIWQDILAQAMTGEILAAMNYASLSEICDDPAEVADALEHSECERGHAAAFAAEGRKIGVEVCNNVDAKHWKRLRDAFLRCITERDFIGCLIVQEIMLESFAVASYSRVGKVGPGSLGETFARIAAEEGEHVDHAMSILRAERARDAQRFDDKVYRLHLDVGATGDVGSGCARCLAPLVRRVLLSARNVERLRRLAAELQSDGVQVVIGADGQRFSAEADVVICAASLASPSLLLGRIASDAIVCDAGYPTNLSPRAEMLGAKVFFGGLGQITGGLRFAPDFHGILNRHPFPDVVHGCLLEGMALALEGRFEPFSQGRGSITQERVEEMETIAARHGIYLAPLYNADGPLEDGLDTRWNGREDESTGERPSRTVESSF